MLIQSHQAATQKIDSAALPIRLLERDDVSIINVDFGVTLWIKARTKE